MSDESLRSIKNYLKMFLNCFVVLETSKRVVIQCPDDIEARGLLRTLHNEGFAVGMRKGLKTDRYYVAVY